MMQERYEQIIISITIAIVSVVLGYFMDPLVAALGLLMALVNFAACFLSHYVEEQRDVLGSQREQEI